ncbi:MAG: PQQ-binding-like beta-propeller repeat protein [Proteobacteria bacterium]|nr:PQQ-binding-like beta-propeller repeat protein [Pseudomonadota bacterium]
MTIKRKIACLNASLALTIFVAAPALADDTELLLFSAQSDSKPNVLFLLDTSGSMNTLEHTIAFYESTITYVGSCNPDYFYWSDTGTPPSCSDRRAIAKTSFVCASAAGQVNAIGSYTGVMAQHREKGPKWQTIKDRKLLNTVECADDSGIHGNGTTGELYAKAGKSGFEFTSNAAEEIDWESFPTNLTYTLYAGNYLNWRENPPLDDIKRIDVVKTVLKKVLSAYDDVNLALVRFNNTDGGAIIHAMQDLETSRASLYGKVDAITAFGNTPLSETLYEAALYWQGMLAHYGELVDDHPTDPDALSVLSPEIYKAPPTAAGSCPRNFNVILTDGLPKNDADTEFLAPTLPGWEETLGRTVCDDYVNEGDCLDDIAEYLFKHDINPNVVGTQFVKTYAAGFLMPADETALMVETTEITGGQFFSASDPESLAVSLLNIFDEITEQSLTFVAPTVAVNAFNRTQNLNDLYMSVFQSSIGTHWPGNLKKYRIVDGTITDANGLPAVDPQTGFFDNGAKSYWTVGPADGSDVSLGGAANMFPDPTIRNLYTNNGGGSNLTTGVNVLTASNDTAFIVDDFGLTGAKDEPSIAEIIRWAKGEDIADEDNDKSTKVRHVMGDPLHAQPAAIDYGTGGVSDVVVYSATNDGYLHAIDGETGVELWSFVPKELLVNFAKLYSNPTGQYKQYGIDGDIKPIVFDLNGNGEIDSPDDFVYIVFGMRRGGDRYYALDVSDRNTPRLLWNITYPEFGQSWSAPVITRVDSSEPGLNSNQAVVIIGAGYDTAHDSQSEPTLDDSEGAGIFMLDLETGATIWRAGRDSQADLQLADMARSFPTQIKVIDVNGDGFSDRMYAADVGGQLWRFDIFSGEPAASLVTGGVIARFGFHGTATPATEGPRRIYNSPDVAVFTDTLQNRRFISVSVGTGYRAHPLNTSAVDGFYSLRDPDVFNQLSQAEYDAYIVATDADMIEVSGQIGTVIGPGDRGWKFTMPADQMVLSNSTTFNNSLFFVGFSPAATATIDCDPTLGRNFLYQVNIVNGDPVVSNLSALAPGDSDAARMKTLAQGGIAPSPTILFPSSDDPNCNGPYCAPPPLGCVGVECFDPGFENNPVRTLWTQDGIE